MRNENTKFVWLRPKFYSTDDIPLSAWSVTHAYLNLKRDERPNSWALGAVAMWQKSNGNLAHAYGVSFSPIEDIPTVLVVGRHDHCHIELNSACSLRHVMIVAHFDGSRPVIQLRDLNTAHGFGVGRKEQAKRAATIDQGRFTLGEAEIRIFVAPPNEPFQFPPQFFPEWTITSPPAGVKPRHAQELFSASHADAEEVSLGERLVQRHCEAAEFHNVGWVGSSVFGFRDAQGRIRSFRSGKLVCLDKPAVVEANLAQIKDGLLLGRYLRCAGSEHLMGFKEASRVHCVLLLRNNKLWLLDTASTNGTLIKKANGAKRKVNAENPVRALEVNDVVEIGNRELSLVLR
ncbi:MAG: hypothetical protein CMH56_14360 [Myxococcales bacterium]|nr:hypothetical protein [Myxococcales bacterium]